MDLAPRSYYDIAVIGGTFGALVSGALLARRGFRVVWVRHDEPPATYTHDGLTLSRRPSAMPFLETPVFRRVLAELALGPVVRRKLAPIDPAYQVVLPGHRVDVLADRTGFLQELRREFPELERPLAEFYAAVDTTMTELDGFLGADVVWPPAGFFERREARRAAGAHRIRRDATRSDPLAVFPLVHALRTFVLAPARLVARMDPDHLPTPALLRTHGLALRAPAAFEGGRDALAALLAEKITQHGGDSLPRERVSKIIVEHNRVAGFETDGDRQRFGCKFVVTSLDTARALRLAQHSASDALAERLLGRAPRYYQYVLNLVLDARAIPMGMAQRVVVVADQSRPLAEENLLYLECGQPDDRGRVVVLALAILPRSGVDEGPSYLARQRERIVRSVATVIPFLGERLIALDSPHDGRPFENLRDGTTSIVAARWRGDAETMEVVEPEAPDSYFGVCGGALRTEVSGLLSVSPQVVAGLGEEGEMLAAVSAARLVTASDRMRARLRRELWSKVEA